MAGYDRYNRSQNILNSEINQQNINVDTLLNGLVRDFSRSYTSSFLPYEIPYMNQATDNTEFPYGYIPTKNSISRYQTVSSCIVRGILPGERPELTTMWTQLGNSASSVILPYFPINTIPNQANNTTLSDYSNNIKAELYYPETVNGWYIIDSYQLENSDYNLNAIWPNFRNFEENIFSSTSTNISTWNNTGYDIVDINNFINNNVSNLINFYSTTLNSGSIYQRPNVIADFSWTKENHQITFLDQSIHGPNINGSGWNWDFNDLYTSIDQDPIHTYTQSGNYFVTLLVEGIDGSTDIIYQPILIDDPVFYFQDTFINASPGDIVDIDIALDMGIDNNLNHFVLNINGFGDLTFNNYTINGLPTGWSSVSNIDNLDFTFLGIPPLENNNLLLTIQLDIPTDPSQEYYNLELNITDVGDLPLIAPYSQNNCIIYINNIGGGNGDLNSNGSTDLEDAFMLLQYLEGNIGLDNEQLVNADVNCDETVEVVDIAAILDFSISNISFLPDCSYSLSNLTDNIDYT
ncbi:MAG: hypothetical protein H8E60_07365, partial [Candidatus Marinimicrobia bacterium]|nr:hypothetical protein [Candidatus Neomarinimicrobiota bacterium]